MKPADMKLSMASAGTLLSFTSHWSSGTYSTWSSTNWTHTNRWQHFFHWGYVFTSNSNSIPLLGVPCSWPVDCPQDTSLTHKTAPLSVQLGLRSSRDSLTQTRGLDFRLVYLQEACGGVDCQVTIWCNQTQSVVQQSFFYESASGGCSGADDDN